uniref:Phosphatidylethanolamine-binding F40A3.3 n=1 Tax=Sipha flava TaxID=143950 RepID=A0A2S2QP17_9HEMI
MWCLPFCLICIALGVFGSENQVDKAMENAKIVPDVIVVGPKKLLQVNYLSGVKAELGNELTPTQVKDQPSVVWDAKPNSFYTLYLADIDITTGGAQPKENEWHQWLVGNILGGDVNSGETLTAFVGSGPPSKTGNERFPVIL